ncbi:DEAD/DEAH box helicase [Clostridium uliginosum]|uniref:Superfamily II DNA or RNA helicase, SNF2 family n=1 Tax=Clostridium uliginosum TaxID=119641 RepID=A0A1I1S6Q0_9CLOT|nr:DEAD/DEAH box helicase [Clostridium uliginosum]SFD42022.1 Superfamily II DNA or RNA helicase, SNF2 family [Clostridium uliginosum]
MKVSDLEFKLLKDISKISLINGKKILDNNRIIRVSGKKIDGLYNIYGKIKGDNKSSTYNPHLRIDLKNGNVLLAKCECHDFDLDNPIKEIFLCEHLASIMMRFFNEAKKQIKSKKESIKTQNEDDDLRNDKIILNNIISENRDKNLLEIDVFLKEVKDNNSSYFEASFFIGNKTKHLVNIKEFIDRFINGENFYIVKGLIYTPKNYFFSQADETLLNFIEEYLSICRQELKGGSIRIFPQNLRNFLNIINIKKIKFKYEYQTYLCEIKTQNMPVSFTLKKLRDDYILRTKKNFPMPLNGKMNAFLYDREIYIPPMNQVKKYSKLYKELKDNGEIKFLKDIKSKKLNALIYTLYDISDELTIEQDIIDDLDELLRFKFNFFKIQDKSICEVKVIQDEKEIDYSDEILEFDIVLKRSKKFHSIESELNKHRFFYRNKRFVFQGDDNEYYNFLKYGIHKLKQLGEVSTLKKEKAFKLYDGSLINYSLNRDEKERVDFSFLLDDLNKEDLSLIYDAWKEKKTYIKLNDESFVNLEDEDMIRFLRIIENLNIDIKSENNSYVIDENKIYYLNDKLSKDKLSVNGREVFNEVLSKLENINNNEFVVPKNLKTNLRDYQIKGYNWLKTLSYLGFGGILADEMGLGKTVQIIAFLLSEENKKSLVITPTSLIYNWYEEFHKFAPSLKIGIVHGNSKERGNILNKVNEYDVVLTTYGTLRNDISKYQDIIFNNVIIDEAQNINNPKAKITEVVKSINSKIKFALTGTPVENNLIDLWSLFDFIIPGYLCNKDVFSKRFTGKDENSKQDLRTMINPYIIRRLKKDVVKELPDKIENKFFVEMTTNQKKLYKTYIKDIQGKLKQSENSNNKITIFSYLTRLRQICLDPSLIIEDYDGGSGKINIAKDLIKKGIESKHKILLFSQFTSVLHKIYKELESEGIPYFYLDGSTPSKDRIKLVEEFNNNKDIQIFLISLKAGGTGLNLTCADMVIHFDPWWNPAIEDQATDRAHRIGQRNVVQVIKLITKGSIEEKILLLQEDKKALIEDVITGELKEDKLFNKLNKDELLDLFKM